MPFFFLVLSFGCFQNSPPSEYEHKTDPTESSQPSMTEKITASQSEKLRPDRSRTQNESDADPPPKPSNVVGTHGTEVQFDLSPTWIPHPYEKTPSVETIRFSLKNSSRLPANQKLKCTIVEAAKTESWSFEKRLQSLKVASVATAQAQSTYEIKLFGLKPSSEYRVEIEIRWKDSRIPLKSSLSIETLPVSPLFPRIRVYRVERDRMEPGLTLFNLIRWENNEPDTDFGAIVAIDSDGVIRWRYVASHLIFIVRQLESGNLIYGYGNRTDGLIEIDQTGKTVRQWDASNLGRQVGGNAVPVPVDSLHHDVFPTKSGTLIALTTSLHEVGPYYHPDYISRPRIDKASIIADEVVEFKATGKILQKYSLFELLDPHRIGYGSLHHFWNSRGYENIEGGTFDWSHSNSVVVDPRDQNLIVSVRHQDAVIKIDRESGKLKWILGTPKGWRGSHKEKLLKPAGGLKWPYHQHAVEVTPQGTLLMFDNGNYQAVPFDKQLSAEENQSRVVEFRINENEMKVEQVWEYAGDGNDHFYSTFLCDVDWLPQTNNVLITNGGEIRDQSGKQTDSAPGDKQWAEIFEVTYQKKPEKVFEATIDTHPDQPHIGWSIYRAERINNFFGIQNLITEPAPSTSGTQTDR